MSPQFWSFQPHIWRATSPNPYKIWAIPEKNKQGGLRTYFFEKPPGIFYFLNFAPGNSRQSKVPPLEIPQIFARYLGSSKAKNQDPWKFHIIFFFGHPWKFHFILLPLQLTAGNSTCYFFDTPRNRNSISSINFWGFFGIALFSWNFQDYFIYCYILQQVGKFFVKFCDGSCPRLKNFSQFGAEWPQEQFKSLIVESWRPCAVLSLKIVL